MLTQQQIDAIIDAVVAELQRQGVVGNERRFVPSGAGELNLDLPSKSLRGNLPPVFDDLPKPLRQEFSSLANFTDDELWAIAQRPPDPRAWRKHERLLELNATRDLNDKEAQELARLQEDMNQHVLKKSFALALLKWRGYAIPNRRRSQNDAT